MLKEGIKAPAFSLNADDGKTYSLKDFKGKTVILYFYPKDNTSGCTAEACDFRDNIKIFAKKNAVILGISKDSIKSHQNFKKKYSLPFALLSDENIEILEKYGVWKEKSMYGRKYMGIERSTFIIDEKGKIKKIYRNVKVKGHIEELLNSI